MAKAVAKIASRAATTTKKLEGKSLGLPLFSKHRVMDVQGIHLENLKYSLFLKRRFLPIFVTVFLGSFNDNLLRSGLVVLIAYSASKGIELPTRPEILVTICSALLVIPLLLFSSLAGPMADKFEKSRLVVITKLVEIGIMVGAYYGFQTHNIYLLMAMLFVSGTHSTFYGPIKFSILPTHLKTGELMAGNGFMAGGTYVAMLLGLVAGGYLVELPGNAIGLTALLVAVVGLFASLFIPLAPASHPQAHIDLNIWRGTIDIIAYALREEKVRHTILLLSWFLLVGSIYMAQFSNYAQSVVKANNEVYILFLTVFSVGIAAGSLLCDVLLKGQISAKLVPISGAGISLFTFLVVMTTPAPAHEGFIGAAEFLEMPSHWPVLLSMLMVAICGGIYIVPLYAILQSLPSAQFRSRVIAASALSDAIFMTLAAFVSAMLLLVGFSITDLFLVMAVLGMGVVVYARKLTV